MKARELLGAAAGLLLPLPLVLLLSSAFRYPLAMLNPGGPPVSPRQARRFRVCRGARGGLPGRPGVPALRGAGRAEPAGRGEAGVRPSVW